VARFDGGVIDGDGHVIERRADLERHGWQGRANDLVEMLLAWQDRDAWGSAIRPEVRDGAFEPDARLCDMDKECIDIAVNYPTPLLGVSDIAGVDSCTSACQAYNDWFAEHYHLAAPDRLHAMALVPLIDPSAAAHEATRAVRDLGAVGASWSSRTPATSTCVIASSTCCGVSSRTSEFPSRCTEAATRARRTFAPRVSATKRASMPLRIRSSRRWRWAISPSGVSWSASPA
jgi:hypothetical protein